MIKKSFRLMLLVAFALSSVMFVACNKYDDDIERIDNEIAALNATVQSLKAAVDGGAVITGVNSTSDGVTFTMSNGQSYKINHGTAGKDGAAGKDGSVVAIGENGNWVIDGVDTGVSSKGVGEPGKAPRINEAGNWEVYNAETKEWEDTKVSAVGASTYVVDMGSYYELNVMEKVDGENAEFVKINLPKTSAITDIKVITLNDNVIEKDGADITLNYGKVLVDDIVFNNETIALEGSNLIAAGDSFSAIINPMDADAALYNFSLKDSKGNTSYVVTASQNKTDEPLTKAKTANRGVWDMSIAFAENTNFGDYASATYPADRSNAVYALTTVTANGEVASSYNVTVTEKRVGLVQTLNALKNPAAKNVGKTIDLTECFVKEGKVDGKPVSDLTPYLVAYYFEFDDATAAAKIGAEINGDYLTATAPGSVDIWVNALFVDGTMLGGRYYDNGIVMRDPIKITATFNYVAPGASLDVVEWTIQKDNVNTSKIDETDCYLPITEELRALITKDSDTDLPTVECVGWKWADGSALNEKRLNVNDVYYGYGSDATPITSSMIVNVPKGKLYRISSSKYVEATSIQNSNYVKFDFNPASAFPGEYIVTLNFYKANSTTVAATVPVKVIIKAPDVTVLNRVPEYFNGDEAIAYGDASGDKVAFNLFDLYKTMSAAEKANVSFKETKHRISGHTCTAWLVDATSGDITVGKSSYDSGSNNRDGVYTTRALEAKYVVYGNHYLPYVYDSFNLTIKSEIAEGTIDASGVSAVVSTTDPVLVSLKDVVAKDVYGKSYNLADIYTKDEDGNWNMVTRANGGKADLRIYDESIKESRVSFAVATGDEQYITVSPAADKNAKDGFSAFTVTRKSTAVLNSDVNCTVVMKVVDDWGRITKTNIKVTLKK